MISFQEADGIPLHGRSNSKQTDFYIGYHDVCFQFVLLRLASLNVDALKFLVWSVFFHVLPHGYLPASQPDRKARGSQAVYHRGKRLPPLVSSSFATGYYPDEEERRLAGGESLN